MLVFALLLAAQTAAPSPAPAVADTTSNAPAPPATTPPSSPPATAPTVTSSEKPARLLVLDLQAVAGVGADDARLITGAVAALIGENAKLEVLTGADIRKMVEVQAAKETIGCDNEGCLAELAGALEAPYVVYGDVGHLGTGFLVNLSLFDSTQTRAVSRVSSEIATINEMNAALRPTVNTLLTPFGGIALREQGTSPLVVAGGVTAGAGALATAGLVGVALVFDGIANNPGEPFQAKSDALTFGLASLAGAGLGAVAVVVGAGLVAIGLSEGT